MILRTTTLVLFICFGLAMLAQQPTTQTHPPTYIGTLKAGGGDMRTVPSLASRSELELPVPLTEEPRDGRYSKNLVVPGKGSQDHGDPLVKDVDEQDYSLKMASPELTFEVNNNVDNPSDPALAVGPEHVVIVYNTGFIIYDKEGNDLTGPMNVNNIFSNNGCCDLTVSYDYDAERWVISYLFFFSGAEVAVSSSSDPMTSEWFVYSLPQVNDYQKVSVWSDSYFMTDNSGGNNAVWAMDRQAMIAGDDDPGIIGFDLPGIETNGFSSPQVLNVTMGEMPAEGHATVIYMQDDAWGGVSEDHVKLWDIDIAWSNPGNATISSPVELAVSEYVGTFDGGGFSNLAQPGGGSSIDAIQATIMNQAQFRKFPTHNSAIFNFVVDIAPGAAKQAAIRWYELRQDSEGMPWSIYQEGTYASPDGKHAWMGSMAMDSFGNIGLGYNGMAGPDTDDPTDFRASAYYTGRFASDPLGEMSVEEELISAGVGNVNGIRFGDYAKLDIDPENDKEFWYITEYPRNGMKDIVGVFQLASDFASDIGVVAIDTPVDGALTDMEEVNVTIFNFGLDEASGFNVAMQLDGGPELSEPFLDMIPSGETATFTFAQTLDLSALGQTYNIAAFTQYAPDSLPSNNGVDRDVTHLLADDVGVTELISPTSGSDVGIAEAISIRVSNFGSATQSNFPVFYSVDGGTAIEETFTGEIAIGETADFTFAQTFDFADLGDYDLTMGTMLSSDADESNDDLSATVTKFICQPEANCEDFDDGVTEFQLADQDISPTCGEDIPGYSDDTDIVFNFDLSTNPFEGVLQVGWEQSTFFLWIDFNDDFTFQDSELVAEGIVADADTDFEFTVDFSMVDGVTEGMHLMRLRGEDADQDGEGEVPCDELEFVRTNDYTANISGVVSVAELAQEPLEVLVADLGEAMFRIDIPNARGLDRIDTQVMNTLGQQLAYYSDGAGGQAVTRVVDMSYVEAGVYFFRIGDEQVNVVKRVVVR